MSVYGFQQTSVYISFRTFQSIYINAIFYLFVALHKKPSLMKYASMTAMN